MDDGYSSYLKEADRADFAEQKLKIAKAALIQISSMGYMTDHGIIAQDAIRTINDHKLKV